MPYRLSPVPPSRMVCRDGIAYRRIASRRARRVRDSLSPDRVRRARRVPYRPSPDTASRRGVACGIARRRIASRRVPARFGDLGVSAVFTVGRAERPSSAMSRPNSAGSRRRHRRFANIYSFTWPSRFSMAPSAARLRRGVGPHLNSKAYVE